MSFLLRCVFKALPTPTNQSNIVNTNNNIIEHFFLFYLFISSISSWSVTKCDFIFNESHHHTEICTKARDMSTDKEGIVSPPSKRNDVAYSINSYEDTRNANITVIENKKLLKGC